MRRRGPGASIGVHFGEAFQRLSPECGGVAGNLRLADALHLRHSPIDRDDQFFERTDNLRPLQRHRGAPNRSVCDRDALKTSPHLVHRQ